MLHPVVVIIDVQNAVCENTAAFDETVRRIAQLIARARSSRVPVVYVQHDGPSGHRLEPDQPGWNIRPEIAPAYGDPVVRKRACDSFFETTLEAELNARNAHTLVVAGCMTQHCVDTSVRRAVTLGYDVILAADGHTTDGAAGLTREQIIAHHNHLLDGHSAGRHSVQVRPVAGILF